MRALTEQDLPLRGTHRGRSSSDLLPAYVEHVLTFLTPRGMRPLTVAIDTANGMGGLVAPRRSSSGCPFKLHHLFPELDGTFPNHPADPIDPENQRDLRAAVLQHEADIGLAFDGDADRVFLIDERGQDVSGSIVTALVAKAMLKREPGASIIFNVICSWTVREVIRENGGVPVRTRVGHSFIKQVMAETGAIFGGEHSGHYYFRENYRADSGLIAAVIVLAQLSEANVPLSELLAPFRRYSASGRDQHRGEGSARDDRAGRRALGRRRQDRLDGLTVEFEDWWCNVRPSNTEPLLRLNVEAKTRAPAPGPTSSCGEDGHGHEEAADEGRGRDGRCRTARDLGMSERPRRDRLPGGPTGDRLPHVRLPVPGPRRHPRDADRRGGEARQQETSPGASGDGSPEGSPQGIPERQGMTVDLDDAQAVRGLDPRGMVAAVGPRCRLPRGYSTGVGAGGLRRPAEVRVRDVLRDGRLGGVGRRGPLRVPGASRPAGRSESLPGPAGACWLAHARRVLVVLGQHRRDAGRVPGGVKRGCRVAGGDVGRNHRRRGADHGIAGVASLPASSRAPRSDISGSRRSERWRPWGSCRRSQTDVTEAVAESRRDHRDGARLSRPRTTRRSAGDQDRRALPGHLGRRRHRFRGRSTLEDPDEREREDARVLVVDVRAGSQRGGGLDVAVRERYFVVGLRHDGEDPQLAPRFPLSYDIVRAAGGEIEEVPARARRALARLMSLIIIGDLTSVYLAIGRGVDPTPVPVIERLKAALAGRDA